MDYGITTAHAHLNRLGLTASAPGEIDWNKVNADYAPTFAGRYFHRVVGACLHDTSASIGVRIARIDPP